MRSLVGLVPDLSCDVQGVLHSSEGSKLSLNCPKDLLAVLSCAVGKCSYANCMCKVRVKFSRAPFGNHFALVFFCVGVLFCSVRKTRVDGPHEEKHMCPPPQKWLLGLLSGESKFSEQQFDAVFCMLAE